MASPFEIGLVSVTAIAAVTDARTGRIPNALTLPAAGAALVGHLLLGGPLDGALALGGLLVCAVPPLVVFRLGGMGGGDVKLFAAIGALVGPGRGLEVQTLGYAVTTLFALAVLARRGELGALGRGVVDAVRRRARPTRDAALASFRLGPPVLVAAVLSALAEAS